MGEGLSRNDSRQSRVITPAVFDEKIQTKATFDVEEPMDKDPKMNHPHIKGGGTLFMGAHIHKDLEPSPGLKFTDSKTSETKEKARLFKERKLSV